MTEDELQRHLAKTLPAADLHGLEVEECTDGDVRLRFSPRTASMPILLSLTDTALRAAAGLDAGIVNLSVTRLRPIEQADVLALARVIRRDGGTIHAECWLFSHAVVEPILHATATLAPGA